MTIRKGVDWGSAGALDPSAEVVSSDAVAAQVFQRAIDDGRPFEEIGLLGGDLHRTLGGPRHEEADLRAGRSMRFPVDLGVVEFEDPTHGSMQLVFVAHLIATTPVVARPGGRRPWWRGRTVMAMNAAFAGDANLAPRSHPNDGRIDVLDGELDRRDRRQALRRSPMGAHVPHPALTERRIRELAVHSDVLLDLQLDGVSVGSAREFTIRCLADAVTVVA